MGQSKPHLMASMARLFFGTPIFLLFGVIFLETAHHSAVTAFFAGLVLAVGLRWLVLGLWGLAKPIPPRPKTYGTALLFALLLGLTGPTLSSGFLKVLEPAKWEVVSQSQDPSVWRREYEEKIPESLRRAEFNSRYAQVRCAHAVKNRDYKTMREVADDVFGAQAAHYDEATRTTVAKAFQDLFRGGLATIKPSKLADPKMQAAFKKVLDGYFAEVDHSFRAMSITRTGRSRSLSGTATSRLFPAQRISFHFDFDSGSHQSIEQGVGHTRIGNNVVPLRHR